jgi:hypothetical protein
MTAIDPFALPQPPNGGAAGPKNIKSFLDNVERVIGLIEGRISRDVPGYQGRFEIAPGKQWDAYVDLANQARQGAAPGQAVDPNIFFKNTFFSNDFLVAYGKERARGVTTKAERKAARNEQ